MAATTTNAAKPILDMNGGEIIRGGVYRVLPVSNYWDHNRGGGLSFASHGRNQCPLDVVQAPSMYDDGVAVKFSNWRSGLNFAPEAENLNIEMAIADTLACINSNYWRIDYDSGRVMAGPKPEEYEEDGFFQSRYRNLTIIITTSFLSFCPGFGGSRKLSWPSYECTDIGIHQDRFGVRRLALNDGDYWQADYWVMFKKANETGEALSKPMPM